MVLTAAYNAASSRTQLKATIASTLDFQNDYTFDNLQRQTRVEQVGQSGGNTVASKRLNFAYNAASFLTSVVREYKPSSTWTEVATSAYTFDDLDRLTGIDHKKAGTSLFTPYAYTYDRIDRITGITSQDGTVAYAYDPTSQLTSADYSYQTDQSFSFDANGNWNMSGYSTGANNQMTSDGTYNYEYDDEGNLTKRTKISDSSYTEYAWDHRQRLTSLTNRNSSHTILSSVTYGYDALNRRVLKSFDADGPGGGAAVPTNFVYDVSGTAVLLEFGGTSNLLRRNLWAEPLDQLLAVETAANATTWGLSDITRTVRDVIDNLAASLNHIKYDANANVTSETATAVDYLMGFGGMVRDEETGLSYAWHRYQQNGHWLSPDPKGFGANDPNLRRVTGNDFINKIDPSGLDSSDSGDDKKTPTPVGAKIAGDLGFKHSAASTPNGVVIIGFNGKGAEQTVGKPTKGVSEVLTTFAEKGEYDVYEFAWSAKYDKKLEAELKDHVAALPPGQPMKVFLVGHSYGGDKATQMADWYHKKISALGATPDVHLVVIDGINSGSLIGAALTAEPKATLSSFHNYYQSVEDPLLGVYGKNLSKATNHNMDTEVKAHVTANPELRPHTAIDNVVATEIAERLATQL